SGHSAVAIRVQDAHAHQSSIGSDAWGGRRTIGGDDARDMRAVASRVTLVWVGRIDQIDTCLDPCAERGGVVVDARVEHGDRYVLARVPAKPGIGRANGLLEDDRGRTSRSLRVADR